MADPNGFSPHSSRGTGQARDGSDGSTRNLQRNPCRFGHRAAGDNQGSPRRYIDGGGKFQGILAVSVASTDKNRDSEPQSRPLPLIFPGETMIHRASRPKNMMKTVVTSHLTGQTSWQVWEPRDLRKPPDQHGDYASTLLPLGLVVDPESLQESATFFASVTSKGSFVVDTGGTLP